MLTAVGAVLFVNAIGSLTGSAVIRRSRSGAGSWKIVFVVVLGIAMYLGVEAVQIGEEGGDDLDAAAAREANGRADLLHRRDERPVQNLDPALTRPGRMGRHITFRTPTKDDRKDIFDLYLEKVAHDPDLDSRDAARRDRADHRAATRRR